MSARSRPDAPVVRTPITTALREAIAARGVSAHKLSKAAQVDPRNIRRWLLGEQDLTLSSADRLAVALGLRVAEAPSRRSPRPSSARVATLLPSAIPSASDDGSDPDHFQDDGASEAR